MKFKFIRFVQYFIYFIARFEMPAEQEITPDELGNALEEVSKNFAYKMLFLQISLSLEGQNNRNKSVEIAELTALYMKAVESLQGRFQQGFVFFHDKIQNLLKRRSVVEELFKSVNSSLSQSEQTMKVISKAEVEQRREEYDLRMTLQNDKFDHKKVKEMIKTAEMKINMIESQIKTGIFSQEEKLAKRIKIRKMKSQSSITSDDERYLKQKIFKKAIHSQNVEQYFVSNSNSDTKPASNLQKQKKRSNEKMMKRKLHLFNSFSNQIKT